MGKEQTHQNQDNDNRPLIAHVIYRLAVGGLENGLVNLINHMPRERARHVIVCISDYTDFADRIQRDDVEIIAMHKNPGKDPKFYWRMWRLFRKLRPDIVHTRNLGAIDITVPAALAGVKIRVQGEHGRDTSDIEGSNSKYLFLRRVLNPLITRYIALSKDLQTWLERSVGVSSRKIVQIYNGVNCAYFDNALEVAPELAAYRQQGKFVIGTVGRLQGEKNQALLIRAFGLLLQALPEHKQEILLVIIGDGPDRQALQALIEQQALQSQVIMLGARDNVPNFLNGFDLFVLTSFIEGVSNTILEAMCMGLPVVATDVGGNRELVVPGETGYLVALDQEDELAALMRQYYQYPAQAKLHGENGKQRVLTQFTMKAMVENYWRVYARELSLPDE